MHSDRRGVYAAVALGLAALTGSVAAAQPASVVAERQAAMKSFGFALRDTAPFANGQAPFDKAKVQTTLQVVEKGAKSVQKLFPADSADDPKTTADPKVWTEKADFARRMNEMAKHAAQARKATDADALKTSFTALSADCKSCHDIYRRKKG